MDSILHTHFCWSNPIDQWIGHRTWEYNPNSRQNHIGIRGSWNYYKIWRSYYMTTITRLINIYLISIILEYSDSILPDYWILLNLTVGLGQISTSRIPCDFASRTSMEFHRISYTLKSRCITKLKTTFSKLHKQKRIFPLVHEKNLWFWTFLSFVDKKMVLF